MVILFKYVQTLAFQQDFFTFNFMKRAFLLYKQVGNKAKIISSFVLLECVPGNYGEDCSSVCGNCFDGDSCHHINGSCLDGCSPGYQGSLCTEGIISPQ